MARSLRFRDWVLIVFLLTLSASLVAGMALVITGHTNSRTTAPEMDDPDYWPDWLARCMNTGVEMTVAPSPTPTPTPVRQTAEIIRARFQISEPAHVTGEVAGRKAHGVFVVVDVDEHYTGDIPSGLTASPLDFQLVDRAGALHCAIQKPTDSLNFTRYPDDVHMGAVWYLRLTPDKPDARISLVFDIDPSLLQGSYLIAYEMLSIEWAPLDIGLS